MAKEGTKGKKNHEKVFGNAPQNFQSSVHANIKRYIIEGKR